MKTALIIALVVVVLIVVAFPIVAFWGFDTGEQSYLFGTTLTQISAETWLSFWMSIISNVISVFIAAVTVLLTICIENSHLYEKAVTNSQFFELKEVKYKSVVGGDCHILYFAFPLEIAMLQCVKVKSVDIFTKAGEHVAAKAELIESNIIITVNKNDSCLSSWYAFANTMNLEYEYLNVRIAFSYVLKDIFKRKLTQKVNSQCTISYISNGNVSVNNITYRIVY